MKAIKLTPKERDCFESLKQHSGGCLRLHIKMTNSTCYRLLDSEKRPVANFRYGIVQNLLDKDIIERNGNHDFILKATSDNKDEFKNIGLLKDYQPA